MANARLPCWLVAWTAGTFLTLNATVQADEPCPPHSSPAMPSIVSGTFDPLAQALPTRKWIDGYFLLQASKPGKAADLDIRATHLSSLPSNTLSKVNNLVHGAFGDITIAGIPTPKSLQQQLQWIQTQGAPLTRQERLLALSLIGSRLAEGYDTKNKKNQHSSEALFQNAIAHGPSGGICGDIHDYLRQVARSLGFEDARVMSGLWQRDPKSGKSEGHFVLVFKDPQSGEYYTQNYSQLVATGQKNLQGALNTSLKTLGPFSGATIVGSPEDNGRYRIFVPQTARWVDQELSHSASFKPDRALFNLSVGNKTQRISVEAAGKLESGDQIKVFGLHSSYNDEGDGPYRVDAIGLALQKESSVKEGLRVVDEMGLKFGARIGMLSLQMPMNEPRSDGSVTRTDGKLSGIFAGMEVQGRARINNTTGRVEFSLKEDLVGGTSTASTPRIRLKTGIDQKIGDSPVTISAERVNEISTRNTRAIIDPRLQTAYDRVSVVYDDRDPSRPNAYLVVGSELYLFDGAEKATAIGLRNYLKKVIPTERLGEFSVIADLSRVVKSKDSYFDTPLTKTLGATWTRDLQKGVTLGTDLRYSNRTPSQLFDSSESLLPVYSEKRDVRGMIWLHRSF